MRRLACLVVAVLVFIPVFAFADTDAGVLTSINQYRATKHLNTIKESDVTCTIATLRSIQIMSDYSHTGFYPLVKSFNLTGTWHENLAQAYDSYFNVVKAWKASPTHNANLLAPLTTGCVRHIGNYWVFEGFHE